MTANSEEAEPLDEDPGVLWGLNLQAGYAMVGRYGLKRFLKGKTVYL